MEAAASPLVLTKLRVPAARPRLISRRRIVDLLAGDQTANFLLVCAPAGYGKTTFLAEWAHTLVKSGTVVAWYALDQGDDDPLPFGAYLIASLIQALGPLPGLTQAAHLLRSSTEIELQRILPALINAVLESGCNCVLILDDYHLISVPAIHSALAYLLEHLPGNLRLAIGSRSDPPLPLARLRARGQLRELRAASLRFTLDETDQFLNTVMRLELSPEGIETLEDRTEGWIAGLQLAALSLTGREDKEGFVASFGGSHRYMVEYLMEEVVDRQTEEVRSFLLSTSILERMCALLCDALTCKESQSETILKRLEAANLFIVALDDEGHWYRYHHLFRDFLRTRLNKEAPETIEALHRYACEWLAAGGLLREAAEHAFQTGDWEYAAAFVERHSFTMIIHSDIATLYEWCSTFPEEVMQAHPLLCIHQSWALVFSFRHLDHARVEARLRQAEQAIAALEDPQQIRDLKENVAVIRAFISMAPDPAADPRKQLATAQSMLAAYPEGNAGRFSALLTTGYDYMALHEAQNAQKAFETARQIALDARLYFGVVESTFNLARLAHCQGQLHRAAEICRQGQADIAALLAHPEQELPALGGLDIALGCVLLEQNRLDEADARLVHGLDLIGWGMNHNYLMVGHMGMFRLRACQGRTAEAAKYLDRLEEAWPDIAFCTRGLRVVQALRAAPDAPSVRAEAADWCRSFSPLASEDALPPGMGPFGAAEVYYLAHLAWFEVQIAAGNAKAARPYLERSLAMAEKHSLGTRLIELSLLAAQAFQAEGDHEVASAALEHALALAKPEGYIRIFQQGPALARLLVETAGRGMHQEYVRQILSALASPPAGEESRPETASLSPEVYLSTAPGLVLVEGLSERELEVLRLMSGGATNGMIASKLVITVGTVKSHINHILRKLDAHNRTEAVARARELNLLETR